MNTDEALSYSLTNTFSTLESLHGELAAIRNDLDVSYKRGQTMIKNIHQYAREIEEDEESENFENDEIKVFNEGIS